MKTTTSETTRRIKNWSGLLAALLASTLCSQAANGSWITDVDGNWSAAPNWLGGIVPDGPDAAAYFTNDITTLRTVTLEAARTNGNLTFGDADPLGTPGGWILAGSALTLSNAAIPVITVNSIGSASGVDLTNDVRINAILTGGQGFVKKGPGTLTLAGANTFSNSVQLDEGAVAVASGTALGSGNQAVIFNGGGVRVWNGGPAYANTNIIQTTGFIVSSNGNYDAVNGPWSGAGTMLIHATGRLTPGNGNANAFANFTGTIDLSDSTTGNETRINLGNGASGYNLSRVTLNTGTNGGRFSFRSQTAPTTVRIGALLGGAGTRLMSSEQAAGTSLIWEIGGLNLSTTFEGTIQNRNGDAARVGHLTKVGSGTLTISGTNTYTGNTTISNGVLSLGTGGTLASSPVLTVYSGAKFDVSALVMEFSLGANQTLTGNGAVLGNLTAAAGTISPGASIGTLSCSNNLTLVEGVTNNFEITSPGVNDTVLVAGDLSLNSSGAGVVVRVRPTGAVIPNGTYTLFKWGGNLTGSGALLLDPPAQTGTLVLGTNAANKEIYLQVTGVAGAANLTWRGDGAGNDWNLSTANWLNGGSASTFTSGDNVTFDNAGSNNVSVNLAIAATPGSLVVNATKEYVLSSTGSGRITGSGSLLKTNTGKLTLVTDNDYLGSTTIAGGTLQVGDGVTPAGSLGLGSVTNQGLLIYNRPDDATNASVISGAGALVQAGQGTLTLSGNNTLTGNVVVSNGTLRANSTASLGAGNVVLAGGTLNALAQVNNPINVTANSGITLPGEVAFAGPLGGTAGALVFNSAGNGFRFVQASNFTCSRPIEIQTGLLRFYNLDSTQTYSGVISGTGGIHRRAPNAGTANAGPGGHVVFSGANTFSGGAALSEGNVGLASSTVDDGFGSVLSGPLGTGTLTYSPPVTLVAPFGYTALYAVGGPRTVANPISFAAITADTIQEAFTVNGVNDLTFSGAVTLGATYGIQVNNTGATLFSGVISGTFGLVKTGPGTLTLSGDNSFTGDLTISAGKLLVQNTSGSGAGLGNVIVEAAGTLGGNGIITGMVTNNGTLAPGTSLGALTINSLLALNAGSTTLMELNAATGANDQVRGLTNVVYGGTLQLTNLAGTLTNGASFQLFVSTSYGGSFAAINPATPGPGQTWNTSSLAADGRLSVVGNPTSPQPAITNVTRLPDGNVQFSFTGTAGQGYRVWGSTNVALSPITNTWTLLTNTTFSGGLDSFSDLQATNHALRFYVLTVP